MFTVQDLKNRNMNEFTFFWGANRPNGEFSQWYKSDFLADGIKFCCTEQYMMYCKSLLFNDYEIADKILYSKNPKYIKSLGRKVKNFNPKVWDEYKVKIVYRGNYHKFTQNMDLQNKLLQTKGILAEASPYDKIWGIGLSTTDYNVNNVHMWKGQNLLGIILTCIREEIKEERGIKDENRGKG